MIPLPAQVFGILLLLVFAGVALLGLLGTLQTYRLHRTELNPREMSPGDTGAVTGTLRPLSDDFLDTINADERASFVQQVVYKTDGIADADSSKWHRTGDATVGRPLIVETEGGAVFLPEIGEDSSIRHVTESPEQTFLDETYPEADVPLPNTHSVHIDLDDRFQYRVKEFPITSSETVTLAGTWRNPNDASVPTPPTRESQDFTLDTEQTASITVGDTSDLTDGLLIKVLVLLVFLVGSLLGTVVLATM